MPTTFLVFGTRCLNIATCPCEWQSASDTSVLVPGIKWDVGCPTGASLLSRDAREALSSWLGETTARMSLSLMFLTIVRKAELSPMWRLRPDGGPLVTLPPPPPRPKWNWHYEFDLKKGPEDLRMCEEIKIWNEYHSSPLPPSPLPPSPLPPSPLPPW